MAETISHVHGGLELSVQSHTIPQSVCNDAFVHACMHSTLHMLPGQ